MEISANTQAVVYLVSAILFILALKGLTHPASARRGNYLGMTGMGLAIVATLLGNEVQSYGFIVITSYSIHYTKLYEIAILQQLPDWQIRSTGLTDWAPIWTRSYNFV